MQRFSFILATAGVMGCLWATAAELPSGSPHVDSLLYTDVAHAGSRVVAVGDRGTIVYSDDQGASWSMADTPVDVLLTAVCFADDRAGWAVGHDATVLATTDGGATWFEQYSDPLGGEAVDEVAEDEGYDDLGDPYAYDEGSYDDFDEADAMAPDTSGAPFLDILCDDGEHLIAVGGYGYVIESTDGGASWAKRMADIPNPDGWHLYAIERLPESATLLVAGEKGTILRSRDNGASWQKLDSPYQGTYFGITSGRNIILMHGMQGNVWSTRSGGDNWRQVKTGVTRAVNTGAMLDDGTLVLAGASGAVLVSHDNGNSLTLQYLPDRQSIAGVLPLEDGSLVMVGDDGIDIIQGIR